MFLTIFSVENFSLQAQDTLSARRAMEILLEGDKDDKDIKKNEEKNPKSNIQEDSPPISSFFFNTFLEVVEEQIYLVKSNYEYTDSTGELKNDFNLNIGVVLSDGVLLTPRIGASPWEERNIGKDGNPSLSTIAFRQIDEKKYNSLKEPQFAQNKKVATISIEGIENGLPYQNKNIPNHGYVLLCTKAGGPSHNPNIRKHLKVVQPKWSGEKSDVAFTDIENETIIGGVYFILLPVQGALSVQVQGLLEVSKEKTNLVVVPSNIKKKSVKKSKKDRKKKKKKKKGK